VDEAAPGEWSRHGRRLKDRSSAHDSPTAFPPPIQALPGGELACLLPLRAPWSV